MQVHEEIDRDIAEPLRALAPPSSRGLDRAVGLAMLFQAVELAEPEPITMGRYVVRERLGSGGMGSVYRARDPELERDVAVKILHQQPTTAAANVIIEEAKALARLAHPNVVTVYDLGIEEEQLFVAMEYVAGATLRQHVATHPELRWTQVVQLFIEAGKGLQAAHEAGVVHRDFKPDNVLISDDDRVLVVDFGLARTSEADARERESFAGTPEYMAPELFEGAPASTQTDQYSFCASMWKILDPSASLGLMRRVGGGYIFLHRTLQDYLAKKA